MSKFRNETPLRKLDVERETSKLGRASWILGIILSKIADLNQYRLSYISSCGGIEDEVGRKELTIFVNLLMRKFCKKNWNTASND